MRDSLLIEKTAANWLARRDRDDWTAEDEAELNAWIDTATAHRIAFIRLNAAWRATATLLPRAARNR